MNTDSVRSVEQLLRRIPFFVSDYNLKLFQFNTQVFIDKCTYKSFRVPGYVNLKQSLRLKTNGYFPRIISCLFVILSNKSMNKETGKYFFAFVCSSKSFAIVCVVVFPFVLLLSIFEWPIVSCTFDWLLLYAEVAVSSDTPEKK